MEVGNIRGKFPKICSADFISEESLCIPPGFVLIFFKFSGQGRKTTFHAGLAKGAKTSTNVSPALRAILLAPEKFAPAYLFKTFLEITYSNDDFCYISLSSNVSATDS